MCPNKFNFLSLILCRLMMFLLLLILFLISSFVIFVAILHLEFFGSISSQMPPVCSCLFSSTSMFHMHIGPTYCRAYMHYTGNLITQVTRAFLYKNRCRY